MFLAINKAVTLIVNLGTSQTGKTTIGYELLNGDGTSFQTRRTTGVSEPRAGTGIYKVEIANTVFTAAFDGLVVWDTGPGTTATGVNALNSATVNAADTTGFAASGTFLLNGAAVTYTGKTATTFTGCGNHAATTGGESVIQSTAVFASEDIYVSDRLDAAISSRSTYAGADTAGTTTLLARLTSGRATNLDNLDATVSGVAAAVWAAATRTLTAFSDSSGVTTLLSRIASALTITAGKVDVNDKTSFALTSAYDPAKTAAQAGDAMALTSGERTTLTAAIWNALTSGLTTAGSIGKLIKDNLDAAISTRLATSGYTAPDNSDVVAIKAKTDNLPADPASQATVLAAIPSAATIASTVWAAATRTLTAISDSSGITTLLTRLSSGRATNLDLLDAAISTRLPASGYTAPDNADIVTILADVAVLLARLPADVWDELLAAHTIVGSAGAKLAAASGGSSSDPWATPLPGAYTGTEAGEILALIKAKTDLIGTGNVTVRSPVTADGGTIEITAGNDYLYTDGLAFIDLTLDGVPDLTTATTITVTIDDALTATATARSATRLTADLPAASSGLLKAKRYLWSVDAVYGGHARTLARGDLIVTAKLTP